MRWQRSLSESRPSMWLFPVMEKEEWEWSLTERIYSSYAAGIFSIHKVKDSVVIQIMLEPFDGKDCQAPKYLQNVVYMLQSRLYLTRHFSGLCDYIMPSLHSVNKMDTHRIAHLFALISRLQATPISYFFKFLHFVTSEIGATALLNRGSWYI